MLDAASPRRPSTILIAATPAGGRLYVSVDTSVQPGRVGAVAHSPTIAALVPFATRDLAEQAFARLGIPPQAIAER